MAKAYEWDFDGSYKPLNGQARFGAETFSVGVFQWLPKKSGNGLKRGAVVKRIRGRADEAERVYAQARAECIKREKGETQ